MKGIEQRKEDVVGFIYVDAEHRNPYMRVASTELLAPGWKGYDKEKYVELALDAAETLLTPLSYDGKN